MAKAESVHFITLIFLMISLAVQVNAERLFESGLVLGRGGIPSS